MPFLIESRKVEEFTGRSVKFIDEGPIRGSDVAQWRKNYLERNYLPRQNDVDLSREPLTVYFNKSTIQKLIDYAKHSSEQNGEIYYLVGKLGCDFSEQKYRFLNVYLCIIKHGSTEIEQIDGTSGIYEGHSDYIISGGNDVLVDLEDLKTFTDNFSKRNESIKRNIKIFNREWQGISHEIINIDTFLRLPPLNERKDVAIHFVMDARKTTIVYADPEFRIPLIEVDPLYDNGSACCPPYGS